MNLSPFAALFLLLDAATLVSAAEVQTSSSFQEQLEAFNLSHQHSPKRESMTSTTSQRAQELELEPDQHHVIWSTSGGGMRSMVANIGYASSFSALGLITENSTKFSGISSVSGGSWFTLLLFFSRPFFDAIVSSTPDEVATLVTNLTSAFASVEADSPSPVSQVCQDIHKYVSFTSIFDDILSVCSFTSDWKKIIAAFLDNAAAKYGDDKLANRLASSENIVSPLSGTWLQIQTSLGASARSSDLNVSYFGPVGELQTTPVPLSWGTDATRGGAWFPSGVTNQSATVVQSSTTFNTSDYSYSNLFPAANDAPLYSPNLLGAETVESLKMPVPFGGEPLLSQLAAAGSAYAAATSGAIPSSFAQTISFLNTTRECNPILSSSFLGLDTASAKALDYAANQIWSTAALDNLSVCSDESGDCTAPFSRLMDGGYSDNTALATNIARYQDVYGAQGPSSTCLRAIVTNNNMYTQSNFNMLSFFNTSFNQGIEPGGFLWPTSWAKNNLLPNPRRSPQIFAECMSDGDLDDALVSIPGTNFSTAVLRGTTTNNDAFGVEAGLCVNILLLQTNSDIPTLVLPPKALAYQDSLAELAKGIASNDLIKERVASFLEGESPAPNFSCSFVEERNIPACEPKKELSPSEVLEAITANDNWCNVGNAVSDSNCDRYLRAILSFNTPIPTVPVWLVVCSIAVAWLSPLLYLALAFWNGKKQKLGESSDGDVNVSLASAAASKEIKLVGLNVVSNKGAKILENVSLHLKPATMNGLLGLSGSGKSTLLGVLSDSLRPNLQVSMSNQSSNIAELNYAFLRQSDNVDMDSMTPVEYLRATARILGTPDKRLHFVLDSLRSMFPLKKETDKDGQEKITLDPFNSTRIAELSGGQRRMVAIGAKLFDDPSILLLDEPLSGLDSASSIELIDMLHLFIERTGLIVLMILHQPSDEILEAMHSITVMIEGRIAFHQGDMMHFNPEVGQAQFVHQILRDGSSTGTSDTDLTPSAGIEDESVGRNSRGSPPPRGIPKGLSIVHSSAFNVHSSAFKSRRFLSANIDIEQQEGHQRSKNISEYIDKVHYDALSRVQVQVQVQSSSADVESSPHTFCATIASGLKGLVSNATFFIKQLPKAIAKDFTLLWQVQPLLRRMQLYVRTPWLDFGVVFVVLVVAGWSQYASSFDFVINDFIQLSLFQIACAIPFGKLKLGEHFLTINAHLNDLKDRKISALAFLLASSIRLISLSVPAAFVAYTVAFALNGWEFGLYLHTTLFAVFYMLNLFQLGKIMALCTKSINTFSSGILAYCVSSFTFSGILAAPVNVHPNVMRIFMYLSIQYWSFSGTMIGWLSGVLASIDMNYEEVENPIIAAEIVPRYVQYRSLTNPKKSLLVLLFVFPFLNMIEYIILLGITSKKPNQYESRKREDDTEAEMEKIQEEDEMEFDETS